MSELTSKKFWADALLRAVRTMAQTALAGMTVGATVSEINWGQLLSASAVAALYSVLMSLNNLSAGGNGTPTQSAAIPANDNATITGNGGNNHD